MLLIWGKRNYGAVEKVGKMAVKTRFGHFWYLPLFPTQSFYINSENDSGYDLRKIHWRSVLCAYLRVWMPLLFIMGVFAALDGIGVISAAVLLLSAAGFIASFKLGKKFAREESEQVRTMMDKHFGIAIDPLDCKHSMAEHIDLRARELSGAPVAEGWYRQVLKDLFSAPDLVELAILRARCEQLDAELQLQVCRRLNPQSANAALAGAV
ncbi:hypothetical protein [Massilia sp. NR 4-1]|uniref:hypothetical protein n=2 Tax=unclassified Massilia TaxID=2609279 RepID=UPI00067A8A0A|nr:hypothetical protein [Massilia sp. NR 4-1]AKU21922.1 hypothetical protein ACZ75_11050 [Massilia sp. NR 4-1]